jgi:hypothetical protein
VTKAIGGGAEGAKDRSINTRAVPVIEISSVQLQFETSSLLKKNPV